MDNNKKKFILKTILESCIFDSGNSENKLLKNAITKRRNKLRQRKIILSQFYSDEQSDSSNGAHLLPTNINHFSDAEFEIKLRMKKNTFMEISKFLGNQWKTKTRQETVSFETGLFITLWKLTHNSRFTEISNLFNITRKEVYINFIKIIRFLYSNRESFIKWPSDNTSKTRITEKFCKLTKNSITNIIGCVDAINIPISPNTNGENSLVLQGICDSEYKFMDIFIDYARNYSKSFIWENSPINNLLSSKTEENVHILGDSDYPLKPYLIVPYCDNYLTNREKLFNKRHETTYCCVKEAFEKLKMQFSILENIDLKKINHIKYIVIACVILHNIIIENDETVATDRTNDIRNNELIKAKEIRDKLAMQCV